MEGKNVRRTRGVTVSGMPDFSPKSVTLPTYSIYKRARSWYKNTRKNDISKERKKEETETKKDADRQLLLGNCTWLSGRMHV